MNPFELLKANYDSFTKSERKAADYILQNSSDLAACSLTSLAKRSGSSNAAVIRMCQKIGFDGFSEFKFTVNRCLLSHGVENEIETTATDSVHSIINTYTHYMNLIPSNVSAQEVNTLAKMICGARRLCIWGVNRTAQSARQLSNRLSRLGLFNKFCEDVIVMIDDSDILGAGDLCILFSMNGRGSVHYPQMLSTLRDRGCYTVLITMNPRLKMVKSASQTITLPWISHDASVNFFEDQIIVYVFIELLLYEIVKINPDLGNKSE